MINENTLKEIKDQIKEIEDGNPNSQKLKTLLYEKIDLDDLSDNDLHSIYKALWRCNNERHETEHLILISSIINDRRVKKEVKTSRKISYSALTVSSVILLIAFLNFLHSLYVNCFNLN